jgi:hypothetical protein
MLALSRRDGRKGRDRASGLLAAAGLPLIV